VYFGVSARAPLCESDSLKRSNRPIGQPAGSRERATDARGSRGAVERVKQSCDTEESTGWLRVAAQRPREESGATRYGEGRQQNSGPRHRLHAGTFV
jgi:hypothetical protein